MLFISQIKTSMKEVIEEIAAKWQLDLGKAEGYLKLEMIDEQPLTIEVLGYKVVSVSQSYILNGDIMRNPEIVFYRKENEWIPIEATRDGMGVYNLIAEVLDDGSLGEIIDFTELVEIQELATLWSYSLKRGNWLENGTPAIEG